MNDDIATIVSELRDALTNNQVDANQILEIILRLNYNRFNELLMAFSRAHGQSLVDRVETECKQNDIVAHLLRSICKTNICQFMAYELKRAYETRSFYSNESANTFIDILCTTDRAQIGSIKQELLNMDDIPTLDTLISRVTFTIRRLGLRSDLYNLLQALFNNTRSTDYNEELASEQAQKLYNAGEARLGTDEDCFIEIFTKQSYQQLRKIFEIYPNYSNGSDIRSAIESETSLCFKEGLLAIANVAEDRLLHCVNRLHNSNDCKVWTRMIVMNLPNIQEFLRKFQDTYPVSLEDFIKARCSDNEIGRKYKTHLFKLIGI